MNQLATGTSAAFRIDMSTRSFPAPSSWNTWRNVYQPDVVIVTGARHTFGAELGLGHVLYGFAPLREAFGLAPTTKPVGTVPALNARSLRCPPSLDLLIADEKSKRESMWL